MTPARSCWDLTAPKGAVLELSVTQLPSFIQLLLPVTVFIFNTPG